MRGLARPKPLIARELIEFKLNQECGLKPSDYAEWTPRKVSFWLEMINIKQEIEKENVEKSKPAPPKRR